MSLSESQVLTLSKHMSEFSNRTSVVAQFGSFWSYQTVQLRKILVLFVFQATGPTSVESDLDRRLPSVSHQLLTVQVPVGLIQLN